MSTTTRGRGARPYAWIAVAAVLLAFALRLVSIESFPPGLYRDEAYYALDAVAIGAGARPVYLEANNGREPLYAYLTALPVAVLGRTPVAARLASVWMGTLAIAAIYAAGSFLVGRRTGTVAALVLACLPWSVMLSRLGLRAGTLVPVFCLAVAASWKAGRMWRHGTPGARRWLALAGALAGATAYTYTAIRVAPLLVAASAAWLLVAHARRAPNGGPALKERAGAAAVWLGAFAVVVLPLVLAAYAAPDLVLGRPAQVAVVESDASPGKVARAVAANIPPAVGMFVAAGDPIPRHNIPHRPVFAPFGALVFLSGLAVLAARRRPGGLFVLAWLAVMLLPTILAEDAPHFLRAVGALPAAALVAAAGVIGLARAASRLLRRPAGGRSERAVAALLTALVVSFELGSSVAMIRRPASDLGYLFESGAVDLAQGVNTRLASGWRGGWAEGPAGVARGRVWLDRRLRDGWASVPYLVREESVALVDPYDPILTEPGAAYLWPYSLEPAELWRAAAPLAITIGPGALERGDREPRPRLLYALAEGEPLPQERLVPRARFANGLDLTEATVTQAADAVRVRTSWRVGRRLAGPATLSVQVLEGGRRITGADAPLGNGVWPGGLLPEGLFPSELWRPGQVITEERVLDVPGGIGQGRTVELGLYEWRGAERADVRLKDSSLSRVRVWPE
jgi:hypothetical protein